MKRRFFYVLTGLVFILLQPLYAQKEGAIWYFGNHAGLDFSGQYPKPLTNGQTNSSEGVASICDKDGKLLFYTDGQTVFSDSGPMTNGTGLSGDSTSTESSIIVPWPNHPDKYYIFYLGKLDTSIKAGRNLFYCIVDMAKTQVDPDNKNIKLNLDLNGEQGYVEKITAIKQPAAAGNTWWILVHRVNLSVFSEYSLSENGVKQEADQVIGLKHMVTDNPQGASGYLKASPNGDYIALAIEGFNYFEVFSFNSSNGKFRVAPQPISLPVESAYGVEFSAAGNYFYGTDRQNRTISRWKLNPFELNAVKASREIIFSDPTLTCSALQLAPNGKIYIAFNNQRYLGVINAPDDSIRNFVKQGASLIEYTTDFKGISGFGLPNIPSGFLKNDICYSNTCFNDETVFYMGSRDLSDIPPDWSIYDMSGNLLKSDTEIDQTKFVFSTPGDYRIIMHVFKNGERNNIERIVTIHPLPVLSINDQTPICGKDSVILHDGHYAFYGISNEDGSYDDRVRTVYKTGTYNVSVTNYQGCSAKATAVVKSKIEMTISRIPADTATVCPGTRITLTVSGAGNYNWNNEGVNQDSYTFIADRDTTITLSGSKDGCDISDSIKIKVFPNHPLDLGADPAIQCIGSKLTLYGKDYDPDSNYSYWEWAEYIAGSDSVRTFSPDITIDHSIPNLVLKVRDQKGCFYKDNIGVLFSESVLVQITSTPAITGKFCPGTRIILTATGAESYKWDNRIGVSQDTIVVLAIRDTMFGVTGSSEGKCPNYAAFKIEVSPNNKLGLGPDTAACAGETINLRSEKYDPESAYQEHEWVYYKEGADSVRINTADIPVVNSIPNLILKVHDLHGCYYKDSIAVTFNPLPVIKSFDKTDITCFGAGNGTLEIKVDGNAASYEYSIDDGHTWSTQSMFQNQLPGDYTAKIRSEFGCLSSTLTKTITEPLLLEYEIKPTAPSNGDYTDGAIEIIVTGGTKPYTFEWKDYKDVHESVLSNIGADTYNISVVDANGCQLPIEYTLVAGELIIPNAFSPDEGGTKNQTWMIRILENRSTRLVQVFDASGKLVYYDDGSSTPWDGTYLNQGKKLPAGTYFYRLQVDKDAKNKPPLFGTVTILR